MVHLLLMLSCMEGSLRAPCSCCPTRAQPCRNNMRAKEMTLQGSSLGSSEDNVGAVTPALSVWCFVIHRLGRLKLFMKIKGHW